MPAFVLLWVWFCAYLNCAGWTLSAFHQLNATGYALALALGAVALFLWCKKTFAQGSPKISWRKYFCRFKKPFPLAFLLLAAMAFLGGAIHAPNNYDALAYRVPRVLHWLAADQWQWIHTIFDRINNRSCGIEWVSAPFIAIFKTERFLFLINSVSFLFLPGLVFSVLTRLGVRRRVAWHWMWIAPTGYCFLLQAGSIGNDLFGAPFALAAVDFALRAKKSRSARDFFTSILAAAMMTSAKTSSLPLLLPWALAIFPSAGLFFRWPSRTVIVCAAAIFASALPTMFLNAKFSGDWSGAALEHVQLKNAVVLRSGANVVLATLQNFDPPVFPGASRWNQFAETHLPPRLAEPLAQLIEWPGCIFHLEEMQMEENAGLGFGVSLLLLASVIAAFFVRGRKFSSGEPAWRKCVRWAPVIALAAVITQSNLTAIGRVLAPYYLLLLPFLLGAGHAEIVRQRWWRASAFAVFLMAAGLLVISPARPLFPAQTLLAKTAGPAPDSKLAARIKEVYLVYNERNEAFAPVLAILPPDLKILGLVTFDDPETSLWHPFGARRVKHVCPGDSAADLKSRGIEYILLREAAVNSYFHCSFTSWLLQMNAQVVQKIPLNLRASVGPLDWYLVKLN
jgi:hypothetical protein